MWTPLWNLCDRWLFGPLSLGTNPLALLFRVLRYPYAILRDLSRGQVNLRAMGLVYTTMLALIPLLAFSFAILKVFGAASDLEPVLYEFFRPLGHSATDLTSRVMQFVNSVSGGIVGSVGFALLLWTLIGTVQKVEDSFNFLWRVEQPRSFTRRITEYVALLIAGPLLLVAFLGAAHATLTSESLQVLASEPAVDGIRRTLLKLSPYAMVAALFTALYAFIPNTRVRWLPALTGGLAAGILWAAVGKVFTAMVIATTRLTIVYAGFAVIVAALLWTYLGWLILLIGAQFAFYLQNPNYLRLGLLELHLSGEEAEELSLKIMYLVGKAHTDGSRRWRIQGLSTKLGLPGIAVAQIVRALEGAGIVSVSDSDELLPARDIGHIALRDVLRVARTQSSGHLLPRALSMPAVDRLTKNLRESWQLSCGERSVRDLVEETS